MDRTKKLHGTNSTFALDPFVAYPDAYPDPGKSERPKSIEQILQEINGFQISPNGSKSATERHTANSLPNLTHEFEPPRIEPVVGTHSSKSECRIPVAIVAPTKPKFRNDVPEEFPVLEFDIRNFESPDETVSAAPAPIRCAFEFDPNFYDYAAKDDRVGNLSQNEFLPPAVIANQSSDDVAGAGVFWAAADDVILIDGNDGFGHIDLACFDISAASFEANRIRICVSDGTDFQIDYRNVAYAVFAGGVVVELDSTQTELSWQ